MRVFDLLSLLNAPLLGVLRGGPLVVPGSVAPSDQEEVLTALQARAASPPLQRVEVEIPFGLSAASVRLLERLFEVGRCERVLLVLREGAPEQLRAVLADSRVRRFPWVAGVVAHPGGDEDLAGWGELGRIVRDALYAAFRERAEELGVAPDGLDLWRVYFDGLTNPCAQVRVANDLVADGMSAEPEATPPPERELVTSRFVSPEASRGSRVGRALVLHELSWRPWQELLVLLTLSSQSAQGREILGDAEHERVLRDLEAQGLWHPEEGLRDWASRLDVDEGWRSLLGEGAPLPTAQQRASGWDARCEELSASISYAWRDPLPTELLSPAVRQMLRLERALVDERPMEELEVLFSVVERSPPRDTDDPRVRALYLQVASQVFGARGDISAALECSREALSVLAGETCFRTRAELAVNLGIVLVVAQQTEKALALLQEALAWPALESWPRHLARLHYELAGVHGNLGDFAAELRALNACLELRQWHSAPPSELGAVQASLAWNALDRRQHELSLWYGTRARDVFRQLAPDHAMGLVHSLGALAVSNAALRQRIAAREALREQFQIVEQTQRPSARLPSQLAFTLRHVAKIDPELHREFAEEFARLRERSS